MVTRRRTGDTQSLEPVMVYFTSSYILHSSSFFPKETHKEQEHFRLLECFRFESDFTDFVYGVPTKDMVSDRINDKGISSLMCFTFFSGKKQSFDIHLKAP